MTAVTYQWYNANEARDYPVSECATCVGQNGYRLPQDIIVDCRISYPRSMGLFPFISAVSLTEHAISICLQVSSSPIAGGVFASPLATLTVMRRDIVEGRPYAVSACCEGVLGFLVLGSGIERTFTETFTSPADTGLAPRAYRAHKPLNVRSFGKLHDSSQLEGIVGLSAEPPLYLSFEEREISSVMQDVIVIKLQDDKQDERKSLSDSPFLEFAGQCRSRPDSRTCGTPEPLEFINGVGPDCDGVLEIEIKGAVIAGITDDQSTLIIESLFGMEDTCPPKNIPGPAGELEQEGALPGDLEFSSQGPDDTSIDEHDEILGEFPFLACFTGFDSSSFVVEAGAFTFAADASSNPACVLTDTCYSTETADGLSQKNIATWHGFDVTTLYRRFDVDLKMIVVEPGGSYNGGLVLNYRSHPSNPDWYVYHVVEVDYLRQLLVIKRFNGVRFVTVDSLSIPGLNLNSWYRLSAEVYTNPEITTVLLRVLLKSLDDLVFDLSFGPISLTSYTPVNGLVGLIADHAYTRFSAFKVSLI